MDIRQLRYFLAVVDHGTISEAAAALRIAQPSLSQAIAALERDVGVPLFHRVGRRVVLSENGLALVGPARVVLRDMEDAESAARDQRELRRGRLDVITMPTPGVEPLASISSEFLLAHPDVLLNINAALTVDEVVESVMSGENELGLVGAASPIRPKGLRATVLNSQSFVLVSAVGWLASPQTTVDLSTLSGLRLIVSQRGGPIRDFVDQVIAAGVDARVVAEVGHRSSILPLVSHGAGQAVLPAGWSTTAKANGVETRTVVPEVLLEVTLLSRPDRLTPAAHSFIEMAKEAVAHSGAEDSRVERHL